MTSHSPTQFIWCSISKLDHLFNHCAQSQPFYVILYWSSKKLSWLEAENSVRKTQYYLTLAYRCPIAIDGAGASSFPKLAGAAWNADCFHVIMSFLMHTHSAEVNQCWLQVCRLLTIPLWTHNKCHFLLEQLLLKWSLYCMTHSRISGDTNCILCHLKLSQWLLTWLSG